VSALSIRAAAAECPTAVAIRAGSEELTFREAARAAEAVSMADPAATPLVLAPTATVPAAIAILAALERRQPLVLLHPRWPDEQRHAALAQVQAHAIPDDTLAVVFTSGSSGAPRPVVLSRTAFLAAAAASAAHLGWREDDAWLLCLPLAHVGGLAVLLRCLVARRTVVLASRGGGELAQDLGGPEITLASLVPTQLASLLEQGASPPARLRAILLGGASAARSLRERACARGFPILTTYGMTETWGQVATQPLSRVGMVDDGVGVALPGVKLVAGTREQPALVTIAAPMLFDGYLGQTPRREPLQTRDLGFVDERGWLVVVGRADEVIITGGENVHPTQVEEQLRGLPGVRAACVFARADERWGQIVAAVVVLDQPDQLDECVRLARHHLASHQVPRQWAVTDALPETAGGKVDRRACAELAAALPR
jgi:O-succinylbenzoic acid--CoA ligase